MKRHLHSIVIAIGLLVAAVGNLSALEAPSELVLKHSDTTKGKVVQVVLDKTRSSIELRMDEASAFGLEIDYLKSLIVQMSTQVGKKTPLSNGYSIVYDGGYLLWGPYHGGGAHVVFSRDISFVGKEIHVKGDTKKPFHDFYKD